MSILGPSTSLLHQTLPQRSAPRVFSMLRVQHHGFCAQTGPLPEAPSLLHITLHATSLGSCSLCVDGLGGLLLVTQDHGPLQPGLMQNLGCFQQQAMPTRKEGSLASAAQPHAELCSGWGRQNGTRYEVGRTRRCSRTSFLVLGSLPAHLSHGSTQKCVTCPARHPL